MNLRITLELNTSVWTTERRLPMHVPSHRLASVSLTPKWRGVLFFRTLVGLRMRPPRIDQYV